METNFDLVIIGSGSAATTAAFEALGEGKKILVIDQKLTGGTCALRGCDPKKILVGVTDSLESAKRLQGHGIASLAGSIDWKDLMAFKTSFTESMSSGIEESLVKNGIAVMHGRAKFTGPESINVDGRSVEGKQFLIASGVKASNIGFPGSEYLIDNEGFLSLPELPKKIVYIGGGYISVEFASIARKAGSDVTIIQHPDRLLVNFDREMVEILTGLLKDSGVKIITNASVKKIIKSNGGYSVVLSERGKDEIVPADLVVHGAGREFDSDMGLDAAQVKWSKKGVTVNEYLQSVSNPRVYAAGDSADTDGPKLTPVAVMEGHVAAENLLHGNSVKAGYTGIPTTVFTSPPLAMVGITEEDASRKNIAVTIKKGEMTNWYNSRRRGIPKAFYKVILDNGSKKVLGASILGENSEEVINIFALAIRIDIDVSTLLSTPFTYPSDTNDIKYMIG
jgi:glutathione reductase (NADPH)